MGVRILEGKLVNEHDRPGACIYDSVTDTVFGPLLDDHEDAQNFLDFLETQRPGVDPRKWSSHDLWAVMGPFRERFPRE